MSDKGNGNDQAGSSKRGLIIIIVFLVIIVALVGVIAFLLGRNTGGSDAGTEASNTDNGRKVAESARVVLDEDSAANVMEEMRKEVEEGMFECNMSMTWTFDDGSAKSKDAYLKNLLSETYMKDILEHNRIDNSEDLEHLLEVMASCAACLTNPTNIANTYPGNRMSRNTVDRYLGFFMESFLLEMSKRFNIRGRKYIKGEQKYYFEDIGLMNAVLNFREMKMTVLIENAVYNELISRGYSVDVGRVDYRKRVNGKNTTVTLETDFVINKSFERTYIQVAEGIDDPGKLQQEEASLMRIKDGFGKMILVDTDVPEHYTPNGIRVMSILDFMSDRSCLEKS